MPSRVTWSEGVDPKRRRMGSGKALRRINAFQKGDERILGDGDFVQSVLSEAKEAYDRKYKLAAKGIAIGHCQKSLRNQRHRSQSDMAQGETT